MSLLVFSPKCKHSMEVLTFISSHSQLKQIVQYHNVSDSGIPPQYRTKITTVPTMLTKNGKILVGQKYRIGWNRFYQYKILKHADLGVCLSTTLDGEGTSDMFHSRRLWKSLQPAMTRELEAKIKS